MGNYPSWAGGFLMSDITIKYYDDNAEAFYDSTVNADMSFQYNLFLKHLPQGAHILDLGCGSGRDSKYFIESGYTVEAVDGSLKLCKKATALIGQPVRQLMFQDMDYNNKFNGIWASASLLHVPVNELPEVFFKISTALKNNGVFYVSFKHGEYSGVRNGRKFSDFTEQSISAIVKSVGCFCIIETHVTTDVRKNRQNEKWINITLTNNHIA